MLPTLTRHHRVVLASVRDPALEAMASRAGFRYRRRMTRPLPSSRIASRIRTGDLLGALGVDVLDRDAETLPPALADHYLMLKARGLL